MKKAILSFGLALMSNVVFGQITNENLVEMKKAGISEEIIKTKIATEDSKFDVSTNGILELKKSGFSDEVISLMIHKNSALKAYSERTGTGVTNESNNAIYSIENKGNSLLINNQIELSREGEIQINLPANKDFLFIEQKKSGLSAKMLGNIADVVGTGASAIGIGTNSIGTMSKAFEVARTARAIEYGADALTKIQDLPISNKAKKIAGKKMKIIDYAFENDGWILTAELDKKKYKINLQEAVMVGEVKLK